MRTLRTHQRRINWLHGKPVVQPAEQPGITQDKPKDELRERLAWFYKRAKYGWMYSNHCAGHHMWLFRLELEQMKKQ